MENHTYTAAKLGDVSLQQFCHDAKVLIETNRRLGFPLGRLLGTETTRQQVAEMLVAVGESVEDRPITAEESARVEEYIRDVAGRYSDILKKYGGGAIREERN